MRLESLGRAYDCFKIRRHRSEYRQKWKKNFGDPVVKQARGQYKKADCNTVGS